MSHRCNKYIIKDGKFIRDFEGMYRHFEDPWDQRAKSQNDSMNNLAFWLLSHTYNGENLRKPQNILDIGCAEGYHARRLL